MIHLRQAATGISASYDALADLFECVTNFFKHLYGEDIVAPYDVRHRDQDNG